MDYENERCFSGFNSILKIYTLRKISGGWWVGVKPSPRQFGFKSVGLLCKA